MNMLHVLKLNSVIYNDEKNYQQLFIRNNRIHHYEMHDINEKLLYIKFIWMNSIHAFVNTDIKKLSIRKKLIKYMEKRKKNGYNFF